MKRLLAALLCLVPGHPYAQSFEIDAVDFSESVYLSEEELQAIAAQYTDRSISLADLQEMVAAVQTLYTEAGIITARAVLPPQEIRDGTLRVELVEALVEDIVVEGFEQTDPAFFSRTLSIAEGQRPDFAELERDLRRYEISYDLRPQLSFRPGEEPGTTVAVIRAEEPERFSFTGSLDNFGSEETGEVRATLFAKASSLTGWRDTLTGQVQGSEGAYSGSLSYARPVGGRGGVLLATTSYADSQIISGPFSAVDIVSNSATLSFGYRQPFRVRSQSHAFGEINILTEQSESELEGAPLSDQTLTELVLTGGLVRQGDRQNLGLTFGLKLGQADSDSTSETEGDYQIAFAAASYARAVGQQLIFDASVTAQFGEDQNLPVARLFTVGGATTVRGYPSSVRSGDSGLLARLQLSRRQPVRPETRPELSLTPFGFADFGIVVPFRDPDPGAGPAGGFDSDQDVLVSLGGGARFNWNARTRGVLMVAQPLRDTLGFEASGATVYLGVDVDF